VVKLSMALLAGLLILASILLIANTIRLSLFARRREVEVMRLVGATNWFIRWPFVIEGIIVGALGGVWRSCSGGREDRAHRSAVQDFALVAAPKTSASPCSSASCWRPAWASRRPVRASRCAASCASET
jgi:cell division transport system permease protein